MRILAPVVRKAGLEVTSLPSGTIGKKFVFRTVPSNPKALANRFLLCSCQPCRERKWLDCEREHECGSWVEAPLEKTLSSTQVSVTRNAIRSRASAGRRAVAQGAPLGRDIVLKAAPEYDDDDNLVQPPFKWWMAKVAAIPTHRGEPDH